MSDSQNITQELTQAEKKKLRDAAYYRAHREQIKAHAKEYARLNCEANRKRARNWYSENRDAALARILARQRLKRDEILAYKAEYRQKNRELLREKQRQYTIDHPEQLLNASAVRRARKRNGTVNSRGIRKWMEQVKSGRSFICYYCQERISVKHIHFDHIVPLSKGGKHCLSNLCASCDECNLNKRAKLINEMKINGQQLMSL